MRRSVASLALVLATTAALSACGGGSAPATNQPPAQPVAATQPAPAAAAGSAAAMDEGAGDGDMAQETGQKVGDDDETTGEKIPQGTTVQKAVAAGMGKDGAPVITVTSSDTGCLPDKNVVPAGKVWFKLVNKGPKINELYLEDLKGTELIEVEKIRVGQSGAFSRKVAAGKYQLACAPNLGDTQIRTPLTVK
jgi:hypothetical protein